MRKYLTLLIIAAIAVAIGIGVAVATKDDKTSPSTTPPPASTTPPPAEPPASPNPAATSANEVEIKNNTFSPATITVKKGTTVTWTNKDSVAHTVTIDSGTGPKSANMDRDDTYSFTFSEAGEFAYHCELHPFMKAKVIVTN